MSGETYFVEKILAKKLVDGQERYLIKWQGYAKQYNSWEPIGNLNKFLVDKFNSQLEKKKKVKVEKTSKPAVDVSIPSDEHIPDSTTERAKPSSPQKILGATSTNPNEVFDFVVDNKDGSRRVMSRQEAHQVCPQLVIDYYERNMFWQGENSSNEASTRIQNEDKEN